jgi:hypothetical protein
VTDRDVAGAHQAALATLARDIERNGRLPSAVGARL